MKDRIRRILPGLVGCVMVLAASSAFPQKDNGPLGQVLNTYNNATTQWIDQFLNYAQNLFVALAVIEFAWTAVILLLEQRELETWVAGFIKKLMGISFFYALLLNAKTWIPTIISSFTQIGQSVGGTGNLTPEGILQAGITMAGQILKAAASISLVAVATGNGSWVVLLAVIAIVIVICYIALTFQFIMAQVEGYIVISTGMLYLGFGGSRWTSSYAERFLGAAVTTGIRIMVIFLIIGLGQQLTNSTWIPAVAAILPQVLAGHYQGAVESAFVFTAGIVIFTALALRLPKVVSAVISGSPSLSGGDLAGGVGSILGGAAAVAGMIAAPEALAAMGGAGGAADGTMSASTAAGLNSASSATSTMGASANDVSPPSSQDANGATSGQNPSSTLPSSANSVGGSSSTASSAASRSGSIAGPTAQPSPPSSSSSNGAGAGSKAGTSAAVNGSTPPATPPPVAESPASLDSASAPGSEPAAPSAAVDGHPGGSGSSAAKGFFASARAVSDGLRHAQGVVTSFENDGGGSPPHSPPPTEGSLRN